MPRATHDLTDRHHGIRLATTVALEGFLDDLPSGTTLEQTIREIDYRLALLESGGGRVRGSLTAGSVMFKTISKSFAANSRIRVKQEGSLKADAELLRGGRITAGAAIRVEQEKSFTADAVVRSFLGTFKADAIKRKRYYKAFFANAVIE